MSSSTSRRGWRVGTSWCWLGHLINPCHGQQCVQSPPDIDPSSLLLAWPVDAPPPLSSGKGGFSYRRGNVCGTGLDVLAPARRDGLPACPTRLWDLTLASLVAASANSFAAVAAVSGKRFGCSTVACRAHWMMTTAGVPSASISSTVTVSCGLWEVAFGQDG